MAGYVPAQYKKTEVATVDSGRLIILLYEGAISFLNKATECMRQKDWGGLAVNVNRAMDIIDELDLSLNMTEGGQIAQNLRRLYRFMSQQLIKARSDGSPDMIDQVIRMLNQLNDAWKDALATPQASEVLAKKKAPLRPSTKSLVA